MELKIGKWVEFLDSDDKSRMGKIKKMAGSKITVLLADKSKHRIHKERVTGIYWFRKVRRD